VILNKKSDKTISHSHFQKLLCTLTELFVHQVLIHRRETDDLRLTVEDIERGNLEIMADLFECKIEDLKISRLVTNCVWI